MAFRESKIQLVDLLSAAEFARNKKRQEEDAKRQALQNQLIQQQIEAAKWQNLKDKERPTMTLPAGPGLGGMREKRFLDEQAGYISGVSPTDTFNQWNQNMRQAMASGGGRGGGGGGGEDLGNTHSDPYSNYTPNQLAELNAINEYQPQKNVKSGGDISLERAANNLGALFRPPVTQLDGKKGVGLPPSPDTSNPQTLAGLLADEAGNIGGMNSLVGQAISKGKGNKLTGFNASEGMTPIRNQVEKTGKDWDAKINTWMNTGSAVPPDDWPEDVRNKAANMKTQTEQTGKIKTKAAEDRGATRVAEQKDIEKYTNELYKNPYWTGGKLNGEVVEKMPENIKKEIKRVLPGFILAAKNKNTVPDIQSLIDSFMAE